MKQLLSILTTLGVALAPMTALATQPLTGTSDASATTTTSSTTTSGGLGGSAYIPTTVTTPVVQKTDAMLTNAEQAADKQDNGQKMAMIAAAVMAGVAAATCPSCGHRGTCGVCAASIVGGLGSLLTANQMNKAKGISDTQAYDVNPVDVAEPTAADNIQNDTEYKRVAKELSDLAKKGNVQVAKDMSSITTPDGRNINTAAAISSPNTSGLNSGEKTALADAIKKAQDKIAEAQGKDGGLANADILEEYAGGGGGGRSRTTAVADASAGGAKSAGRNPSSVAGAFKEYNGEKIGVSVDSMFEMMHRRYKFQGEEKKSFLAQ